MAAFFCALPPVCWRRPPGGVDLGTAFLHHLDRKAFQEYFAKFRPDETLEETLDVLTMLIDGSSYRMDGKNIFFYF